MYLTYLDSNSWLWEMGEKRILVDPWLVGPLVFGNLPWLFKGERRTPRSIPENVDLILLSQGLPDHAHPPTLEQLDRAIPVVGSEGAAKVVRELGYTQVTALAHGETFVLRDAVEITAVPGSPIGLTTVENGYVLRDLRHNRTLYYEPHGYHSPTLKEMTPIDVAVTPIIDLTIPLLGSVIKGQETALELAKWVRPQVMIPTAAGGDVAFEGLLIKVLQAKGSAAQLQAKLAANDLATQVVEPPPGERFELQLNAPTIA
ncbi:MAG TPA: MBL fold metallo-hydrolase [Oscillatoriales cyanobacterium M59_W2019_021]|nr:MAG: MBL fold metallo-hydrolase [Cyanobacteria bacterium J055]HIK33457.1 MBL fold metallo-hydrolase [Oscillatoriales cyanobacterium M4454_W2019_049]HIK51358.1 MBL fold metallo-hydrolase [Oscillatoriales cyanobacterium M59_W2019_021]